MRIFVLAECLLLACLTILMTLPAKAQSFQCPAGSTPVYGIGAMNAMMCRCPNGSWASINGCAGSYNPPPQQQVGDYCRGGGICPVGTQCTADGQHCMHAGDQECGNRSCGQGTFCGSNNQCMAEGSSDCGNGSSCASGFKCSKDLKQCLTSDVVDCRTHTCAQGQVCGSKNQCLAKLDHDCGNGSSCPSDKSCRKGGGCATQQELDAEKAQKTKELADKKEADRLAVIEKKKVADDAAKEKQLASQKAIIDKQIQAETKAAQDMAAKDQARTVALEAAQKKLDDAAKSVTQQLEIAKIQAQTKKLEDQAAQLKKANQQNGTAQPTIQLNQDLKDVSTLKPKLFSNQPRDTVAAPAPVSKATCLTTFQGNGTPLDKNGCPIVRIGQSPTAQPTSAKSVEPTPNNPTETKQADRVTRMTILGNSTTDCGNLVFHETCPISTNNYTPYTKCYTTTINRECDVHSDGSPDQCSDAPPIKTDNCN